VFIKIYYRKQGNDISCLPTKNKKYTYKKSAYKKYTYKK